MIENHPHRSGAQFFWIAASLLRLAHDPVSLLLGLRKTWDDSLRLRHLNEHVFGNLAEARKIIENWGIDYNTKRSHTSFGRLFGGLAPAVYASLNRATRPASLELRKCSAQQVLIATELRARNRNVFYTQSDRIKGLGQFRKGLSRVRGTGAHGS